MASEPLETNLDEVSSKLRGGLETCRSVIANYRSLLSQAEAQDVTPANTDNTDGASAAEA